jgi:23S rRNA (uracil1939-C5)-methyltransferase
MSTLQVTITRLAHGGDGIGEIDGKICFVPYGLPGDTLEIILTKDKKTFCRGKIKNIITPSPDRTNAECPVYGKCGGCSWLHLAYPAQLEWKQKIVKTAFEKIAKINIDVAGLENPELRTGYRTRATFKGHEGAWGFYAPESHDVVDIDGCPLCHPKMNDALTKLKKTPISGEVEVLVNPEGDEVFLWTEEESKELKEDFPCAQSLEDGNGRVQFMFDDIPVVNGTFNQSSLKLNRILVNHVQSFLQDATSILDLYCGSGNMTLALADKALVVGLDKNGPAIQAADHTERGEFHIGSDKAFPDFINRQKWSAIVLDPPRVGAKHSMEILQGADAEKIIYISCDPATLARDTMTLLRGHWKITSVTAIDIFPNTNHIETVCVFERADTEE